VLNLDVLMDFLLEKKKVEKNSDSSIRLKCIDYKYLSKIRNNNIIMIKIKVQKNRIFLAVGTLIFLNL
jgi:hypothetical protein